MKAILKNPITIWLCWLIRKYFLEARYRGKSLKIGYLSNIVNCRFGNYNTIYENVKLCEVEMGNFSYVADNSQIFKTKIGKYCSIGPNVKCGLGQHPSHTFVSTHPIFFSVLKQAQVTFTDRNYFEEYVITEIGNDVWIGANAIILDGVRINDGAIIAAGAVATKDVPPYAIVGGVPAKVIKYRFNESEIKYLLELKWWDRNYDWLRKNFKIMHDIKDFRRIE